MSYEQFWITAIVFTIVGWFMRKNQPASFKETKRITSQTIDTLIAMGYLKTLGDGDDQQLVKYDE